LEIRGRRGGDHLQQTDETDNSLSVSALMFTKDTTFLMFKKYVRGDAMQLMSVISRF